MDAALNTASARHAAACADPATTADAWYAIANALATESIWLALDDDAEAHRLADLRTDCFRRIRLIPIARTATRNGPSCADRLPWEGAGAVEITRSMEMA